MFEKTGFKYTVNAFRVRKSDFFIVGFYFCWKCFPNLWDNMKTLQTGQLCCAGSRYPRHPASFLSDPAVTKFSSVSAILIALFLPSTAWGEYFETPEFQQSGFRSLVAEIPSAVDALSREDVEDLIVLPSKERFHFIPFEQGYWREIDIPEPMIFDLVRPLDSDKGDYEFNTLFVNSDYPRVDNWDISPEFEWVMFDGFGLELELPSTTSGIHAYKGAFQYFFGEDQFSLQHGIQFIAEHVREDGFTELSPLYIQALRIDARSSYLIMIGNRFHAGHDPAATYSREQFHPLINVNYFYNITAGSVAALEVNLNGADNSFRDVLLMPQYHISLADSIKIQMGAGVRHDGYNWDPTVAFRLVYEANF